MRGRSRRLDRVADLIRSELSDVLLLRVKDPRVARALVTVTGVDVSPDLRHARVFVSAVGTPQVARDSLQGLRSAAGYLRRELGQRIHLKYTPELRFERDPALDRGARIEEALARSGPPPGETDGEEDA